MKSVFISSTSRDLQPYRNAVKAAIERLDLRPIDMRNFGSQPGGAVGVSVREVSKADIFVGILAQRYGYVPEGMAKSVTEQEYDEAARLRLPRLMYLLDPGYPWNESLVETDTTAQARLAAFKQRVEHNEVRSLFTTPEDLAAKVTADLVKLLDKQRHQMLIARILATTVVVFGMIALVLMADPGLRSDIIEVVGLASATPTMTATFTPTHTPTPTPRPTATPLEGIPFAPDQVGIVLADFTQRDTDARNIIRPLELALEQHSVPLVRVHHPISSRDQAQRISDLYNSTIVVWGENFEVGVLVNYEITPRHSRVETSLDSELIFADLHNFATFVLTGMDSQYVVDFIRGQQLYFGGQLEEALSAFDRAIQQIPRGRENSVRADALFFYRAGAHYYRDNTIAALNDINRVIELNPELSRAYFNRGVALYRSGQTGQAIANYDQAIQLDTVYADAYNNRGLAYKRLGNFQHALDDLTYAVNLNRIDSDIYTNRGIVYRELGNYQKALQDYGEAAALNPNDADIFYNRGITYHLLGNYEKAIADYDEAIRLYPDDADFYINRGLTQGTLGNYELAIQDYNEAIRLDSTLANAYLDRGLAYLKVLELVEALEDFTRAIELNPDLTEAYLNRASLLLLVEEYDLALDDLNHAVRIAPENPNVYGLRGLANYGSNRYTEAIADYLEYEHLTGYLEPQMEQQIAEMDAAMGGSS